MPLLTEMSTDNGSQDSLTEEQVLFIEMCESEFANRYTDTDKEFCKVKERSSSPPIADPWYPKSIRNFEWSNRDGGSHRRHQNWGGRWQNQGGGYGNKRQGDRFFDRSRPY